jgi:hypothetical protein
MRFKRDFSPASWLMAAILLITAASVFGWGTSYKLSLYKSAIEQGKIPVAKLCTRASDAAKADVEMSVTRSDDVAVSLSVDVSLPPPAPHIRTVPIEYARPRDLLAAWDSPALFLRPPPTL